MEEVVANIRSSLISTKGPSSLHQLQKDYREIVGEFIPFKKLGYTSLESFLDSVPSLKLTKLPNGVITVDAIATDNVKHIVSLVNKQKTSKKKVGYVASRFRGYTNKSPGYSNRSPSYSSQQKRKPRYETPPRQHKYAAPKPVGNKRRLSVFERLGPKIQVSSEENLSTFDEDEDDFVSKFQSNRQVTRLPIKSRMSLPASIKITSPIKTTTRFLKKSPPASNSSKEPNVSPSSSSDLESQTWMDAATAFKKEDELTNRMSRLSIMLERIQSRNRAEELPAPSDMVYNNNLPVGNNNAPSDMDRPRMRTQRSLGAGPSIYGATRPRPAFVAPPVFASPSIIRSNIPRFNQNRLVSSVRLPWQSQDKPVVMIETTVDHRIQKKSENIIAESSKAVPAYRLPEPLNLEHLVTKDNDANLSTFEFKDGKPLNLQQLVANSQDEIDDPLKTVEPLEQPMKIPFHPMYDYRNIKPLTYEELIASMAREPLYPDLNIKVVGTLTREQLIESFEKYPSILPFHISFEETTNLTDPAIPDNLAKCSNEETIVPESSTTKDDTITRWSDLSTNKDTNILDVIIPENFKMEPTKTKIPKRPDIPKLKSFLDVKVSHVVDPHSFYVQPIKSSPILNAFMGKIQTKYSENSSPCDLENIFPNEFYALKHQDQFWYRVKITSFVSRDRVTVFFCDFGYQVEVSVTELVALDPEFYEVPFQAIKAQMTGICPINDTWTLKETRYFSDRALEKSFVSVVTSVDNGDELILGLKLIDTTGDDDVNIGKEMVENYVAQYDLDV